MLTFISYWRVAAIVLNDLASTVYYIEGIAEQAIGKGAPWFILAVMLFSGTVRLLYIESSSMFVRGGVYKVVKESMGGGIAKLSVAALMFDYILTGPISAVSAGFYFAGLINTIFSLAGLSLVVPNNATAVFVAILITLYFLRKNIIGIEESSDKALKIMQLTTVMGVVMIIWCGITLAVRGVHLPPFEIRFTEDSLGWLKDVDWVKSIGAVGILIALGHSMLAMSGEETLAQVYREVESPKLPNLKKAGLIIFIYSMIITAGISFFAVMIIPDDIRIAQYADNVIGGLAMNVVGPTILKLFLQAFVVLVGFLILAGAVNTSIIGANGVMNRLAEDGVLTDWFRHPHKRFGTTNRIFTLLAGLQILTIIASRGDIYVLGQAYAFGVIWSFVFKALAVFVLRFKDRSPREYKVPLNIRIGSFELPLGLIIVFLILFSVATINLFTKQIATQWGAVFTAFVFVVFSVSEQINRHKAEAQNEHLEKFNVNGETKITPEGIGCQHQKRKLVTVRAKDRLYHLAKCLEETDTDECDVVVMNAKLLRGRQTEVVEPKLSNHEQSLFSEVVSVAEKIGKPVIPVVIPTNNIPFAVASVAKELDASEVTMGISERYDPDFQLQQFAILWGTVQPDPRKEITVRILAPQKEFKAEL